MIVHKNWVVNLALSSVIAVTCAAGDKKLKSVPTSLKKVLLVDNAIHGIVGLFSVFITFMDHSDLFYLAIACMMISSLIDVDHFIAAKSLKLSDATNLQTRPFLHNSSIPVAILVVLLYCHFTSRSEILITSLILFLVAFLTHHLRDANKHGLLFEPFGSTPALNDLTYILLTLLTPYLTKQLVPSEFKYSRVKSTVLDV